MSATAGILLAGGALLAVPATLLGRTPAAARTATLAVLGLSLAAAAAVTVRARRQHRGLHPVGLHGALVLALAVVTTVVWSGRGDLTSVAALGLFAWPPLFATAFLSPRHAAPYVLASAAASVLVVALTVHQTALSCAITSVGTIAVAAATAGLLRALLLRSFTADPLTGLPGRHALDGLLARETRRAARRGSALALAVVDLDDFKTVNDTGGHRAGDELLRRVAQRWRRQLRAGHELVRAGGDEFVVILPGCDTSAGGAVVEGLRRAGGHPCSAGLARWHPGEDPAATLVRADAALYEAKRRGGDRTVAEPGPAASGAGVGARASRRWWPHAPQVDVRASSSFRAQLLGAFLAAGAAISLPGIILDPAPHTSVAVAVANAAVDMAAGIALAAGARRVGDRVPMWVVHAGMVASVVILCGACLFARGGPDGIVSLGMVSWAAMYVTALFPWRVAAAYCGAGSLAIAATIGVAVHGDAAGVGLLCLGAALGAGVLVGYLAQLLRRQAELDPLTGLPSRATLDGIVEREMVVAGRTGRSLCLALVDLDHLKAVNDTAGHAAGDRALRSFAQAWRARLRPDDVLVRYGGDEFVLVLPGCDLDAGTDTVTRVSREAGWSSSVGLTAWGPGDGTDDLLARADRALYRAKADGRSRVVAVAPPLPEADRPTESGHRTMPASPVAPLAGAGEPTAPGGRR